MNVQVPPTSPFMRGALDCMQDRCENVPFMSIGGLSKRTCMEAPEYIPKQDREAYLAGYRQQAEDMFGSDWATCEFGWSAVLTVRADELPKPETP